MRQFLVIDLSVYRSAGQRLVSVAGEVSYSGQLRHIRGFFRNFRGGRGAISLGSRLKFTCQWIKTNKGTKIVQQNHESDECKRIYGYCVVLEKCPSTWASHFHAGELWQVDKMHCTYKAMLVNYDMLTKCIAFIVPYWWTMTGWQNTLHPKCHAGELWQVDKMHCAQNATLVNYDRLTKCIAHKMPRWWTMTGWQNALHPKCHTGELWQVDKMHCTQNVTLVKYDRLTKCIEPKMPRWWTMTGWQKALHSHIKYE